MSMLSVDVLIGFIVASTLISYAPGPDNIFVLIQSILHGRKAGIIVTLGLCTGLLFHTVAVTLGVAAIFQASAVAFTLLKIVGVVYLLYLAFMSFRAAAANVSMSEQPQLSAMQLYRRGILMSSTNPKLAIFFMAFLPQFADPAVGSLSLQLFTLSMVFIVVAFFVMSSVALLSGSLRGWIQDSELGQSIINKVAGTVFVGLALKLVTTER
ncbi:LysE family translocator [Neptuniibacter sp. QD34_54]|uniref:LysE family translocator n=1 Tax=Neptuniibacter sp. QD34_54 TaxID=3398208 RepID=UPI0039F5E333